MGTYIVHFTFTGLYREFYIQLLEAGWIGGLLVNCSDKENGFQHLSGVDKHWAVREFHCCVLPLDVQIIPRLKDNSVATKACERGTDSETGRDELLNFSKWKFKDNGRINWRMSSISACQCDNWLWIYVFRTCTIVVTQFYLYLTLYKHTRTREVFVFCSRAREVSIPVGYHAASLENRSLTFETATLSLCSNL